jgi:hypothetical protein
MARSLENMLKSERRPWLRDEREGYPFNDIGKSIYLKAYCTAIERYPSEEARKGAKRRAAGGRRCGKLNCLQVAQLPQPAPDL